MAENRGPELRSITIFFLCLTWPAVMVRCYVRVRMVKAFGADDWTMLGALISYTIYCALVICGIAYGTGRHIADISPANLMKALKLWWLSELPYFACSGLTKISIGLFLLRVVVEKSHIWFLYAIMAINTIACAFFFFFMLFQCSPISYFWNRHEPGGGHCLSSHTVINSTYAFSAISSICDFSFGILPIFIIWDLKINRRSKCAVLVLLSIAAIACTATVIRIPYITSIRKSTDYLYATVDVSIWSSAEIGLAITAASLATMRPLMSSLRRRRSYPAREQRPPFNPIHPRPSSSIRLVSSLQEPPPLHTLEGHHHPEGWLVESAGPIAAINGSLLSPLGTSSSDSENGIKEAMKDVEEKGGIQETFETASVVKILRPGDS